MNERLSDEYIADCLWGYDHGNAMDDPDVIGVLNEALARGRELDEATKGRLRFLELFEQAEQQLDAAIARAEKAEGLLREAASELEGWCTNPMEHATLVLCNICEAVVPMKDSADYKLHGPGCILHRVAAALEAKPPRAVPAQGPPGARASGGRTMSERERLSDEQIREAAEFLRKLDRCETHRDLVSMVEGECLARGRERDAAIARAEKAEGLLQQLTTCRGRFEGRDAFCRYCANAAELAALEGQP